MINIIIINDLDDVENSFQDSCNIIMDAVVAKGVTPASNSPLDIATAISQIETLSSSIYFKIYATNPYLYCEEYINDILSATYSGIYFDHDNVNDDLTSGSGDDFIITPIGKMFHNGQYLCIRLTCNISYSINNKDGSKIYLTTGEALTLPTVSYTSEDSYYIFYT